MSKFVNAHGERARSAAHWSHAQDVAVKMKRSTAGLLPVMFPVRRRYQRKKCIKKRLPPGYVSGEETRENRK
jgi:hypothetical protein